MAGKPGTKRTRLHFGQEGLAPVNDRQTTYLLRLLTERLEVQDFIDEYLIAKAKERLG